MKKTLAVAVSIVSFAQASLAVDFSDSFEPSQGYAWDPQVGCREQNDPGDCDNPYDPGFGPFCSQSNILGLSSTHQFFVSGTYYGEGCSPSGVNYFTGGGAAFHGATNGSWVIANTPAGQVDDAQSHEMLVSRSLMATDYPGNIQVDFKLHGSGSPVNSEHYVLASNVGFHSGTCTNFPTSASCGAPNLDIVPILNVDVSTGCTSNAGSSPGPTSPECGYVQDQRFYAVIAGNFGSSCTIAGQTLGSSKQGFVLEKAVQTATQRSVCLVPQTFIPHTVVPNTWYRMKLERAAVNQWTISAWVQSGSLWTPIGSKTISGSVGDEVHQKYQIISGGRMGMYGYWLRGDVHVDFDNVVGNW